MSLLDGNLSYVTAPGVSAQIEVGSGGLATLVGGTKSTLFLWQPKNVLWEHNGLALEKPRLPETQSICDEVISLPMSAETTLDQVEMVVRSIREFFSPQAVTSLQAEAAR